MFIVSESVRDLLAYKARNNHYKFKPERPSSFIFPYYPLRKSYQEEDKFYRKGKFKNKGPRCLGRLEHYSDYIKQKKRCRSNNDGYFWFSTEISKSKQNAIAACKRMRAL